MALTSYNGTDERREVVARVLDVGTEEVNGTTYMTFIVAGSIGGLLYDEVWYGIAYRHFKESSVWFSLSLGHSQETANDVLPPVKFEAEQGTRRHEVPLQFFVTTRQVSEWDALAVSLIGVELRALLADCKVVDQFGVRVHVADNDECEREEHAQAIRG